MNENSENELEKAVAEGTSEGLLAEFWWFICDSKKWWMLPIVLVLFVFGLLMLLSGTAAAPFIYTLF